MGMKVRSGLGKIPRGLGFPLPRPSPGEGATLAEIPEGRRDLSLSSADAAGPQGKNCILMSLDEELPDCLSLSPT